MEPTSSPMCCRYHPNRRPRGAGLLRVRSRRSRRLLLVAILMLASSWPSGVLVRAACTGGIEGIEASGVCCIEACGTCGGSGCGEIPETTDGDCCVADITDSGVTCGGGNVAPCIIDPNATAVPTPSPTTPAPGHMSAPTEQTPSPGNTANPQAPPLSIAPTPAVTPTPPTSVALTIAPTLAPTSLPPTPVGMVTTIAPAIPAPTAAPPTPMAAPTSWGTPAPTLNPTTAPTTRAPMPTPTPTPTLMPASMTPVSQTVPPTLVPQTVPPTLVPTTLPAVGATPGPSAPSTCSNGLPGLQASGVCCSVECEQCGGSGCSEVSAEDCCVDAIKEADVTCGENGAEAPCIIRNTPAPTPSPMVETEMPMPSNTSTPGDGSSRDITPSPASPSSTPTPASIAPNSPAPTPPAASSPAPTPPAASSPAPTPPAASSPAPTPPAASSPAPTPPAASSPAPTSPADDSTCSNGIPGYQQGNVCCSLECGQCGGSGCENIPGTDGASACCFYQVLASGLECNATVFAPCIIGTVDEVEAANEAADAAAAIKMAGRTAAFACATLLAVFALL